MPAPALASKKRHDQGKKKAVIPFGRKKIVQSVAKGILKENPRPSPIFKPSIIQSAKTGIHTLNSLKEKRSIVSGTADILQKQDASGDKESPTPVTTGDSDLSKEESGTAGPSPTGETSPRDNAKSESEQEAVPKKAEQKKKVDKGKKAAGKENEQSSDEKENADAAAQQEKKIAEAKQRVEKAATEIKGPASTEKSRETASHQASKGAEDAAVSPAKEPQAIAEEKKVGVMEEQEPETIDQKSFVEVVRAKLTEMKTPANLEEMEDFKEGGEAKKLQAGLTGEVKKQTENAQGSIKTSTEAELVPGEKRKEKQLPPIRRAPAVGDLNTRAAIADPKDRSEVETPMEQSGEDVERQLADNRLTKERLLKANDPRFTALQDSGETVHKNIETAPKTYREGETGYLNKERSDMTGLENKQVESMQSIRGHSLKNVTGVQKKSIGKDEAKRKEVTEQINKIYGEVEKKVTEKLTELDASVEAKFTEKEKKAREDFENYVSDQMRTWKQVRYGTRAAIPGFGIFIASATWAADKLFGIDDYPEVKAIFTRGRERYLENLENLILEIASEVDKELNWCKTQIKEGREKLKSYLESLDKDLKKYANETAAGVFEKFDELDSKVESKKDELADALIERGRASIEEIDKRIEELKAENRGLVDKFVEGLTRVLEIINNLRIRLVSILGEAKDTLEQILDDPIQFLKNLLEAVKLGFTRFSDNIWTHLKAGLIGWLFGTLGSIGIQVPTEITLKSIMALFFQILGLTYENLRKKAVRLIGARNVAIIEHVAGYLTVLFREGPAGLWELVKDQLTGLKDMVMDAIKEWLITKVVKAAVLKLASMFNPVGAIIQAALTIYNVVMFFIERINQILDLVQAVVRSLSKIVRGELDAAANWIEKAMARIIPLIIAFLARLLGIGGIAEKIKKVIGKIRGKVDNAINKALNKIAKKFRSMAKKGKAAISSWFKSKKKFKSKSGKPHTLSFNKKSGSYKLIMASKTTKGVEDWIKEKEKKLKSNPKKEEATALGKAKKVHISIQETMTRLMKKENKEDASEVKKLLEKLANHLKEANIDGLEEDLPLTHVEFETDSGLAKKVKANPLTKNPGNTKGSEPDQSALPHAFGYLEKNRNKFNINKWVRGHLLNHRLHGPGSFWNLVPLRKTHNSQMLHTTEKKVKNEAKNNHILSFMASIDYHKPTSTNEEKYFPSKINLKWGIKKGEKENLTNNQVLTPGLPYTDGTRTSKIKLDDLSVKDIGDELGLKKNVIKRIKNSKLSGGRSKVTLKDAKEYYLNNYSQKLFDGDRAKLEEAMGRNTRVVF